MKDMNFTNSVYYNINSKDDKMEKVVIIGAGPAGLTAAYEILKQSKDYKVIIVEKEVAVGGLSKTYTFSENKVDIGGHRFFSKDKQINSIWDEILPIADKGMRIDIRHSHIFYNKQMYEYPIRFSANMLRQFGTLEGMMVVISYLKTFVKKRKEISLEDFYINRFGKKLYEMFFEQYTYKLWGMSAKDMASDWGTQRIQGISLRSVMRNLGGNNRQNVEKSFIESYRYPSYGSGQFWDCMADEIRELGGNIIMNTEIVSLEYSETKIRKIICQHKEKNIAIECDKVISSMPLNELLLALDFVPENIKKLAKRLRYRDMIIVALEIPENDLGNYLERYKSDSWIYIQDKNVCFGRIQLLNNWSPYVVHDACNYVLEMECFCTEGDSLWLMDDDHIIQKVIEDLKGCGFLKEHKNIQSSFVKKIQKAYPIYTEGYYNIGVIQKFVNNTDNLYCIGRNGQHHYNNMDHSMMTGIEAAQSILYNWDKKKVWDVNVDQEYQEIKR
jgi:protoporphyrinogen oxidase